MTSNGELIKDPVQAWECFQCGFAFAAEYHDVRRPGTALSYTCPVCAEDRLQKELHELKSELSAALNREDNLVRFLVRWLGISSGTDQEFTDDTYAMAALSDELETILKPYEAKQV